MEAIFVITLTSRLVLQKLSLFCMPCIPTPYSDASRPDPAEAGTNPQLLGLLFLEPGGAQAFSVKLTNEVVSRCLPRKHQIMCASALHHTAARLANHQMLWFVDNLGAMSSLILGSAQKTSGTLRQCRSHWPLSCRRKFGMNEWTAPPTQQIEGELRLPALQTEWLASSRNRPNGFFLHSQCGRVYPSTDVQILRLLSPFPVMRRVSLR